TATEHAASLTHGLLTMSRQNRLKLETLDLARELREVEKLVSPLLGKRVSLEVRMDPSLSSVHGDSSSLKQILMNLVLNARDAMPGGGTVTIAVQPATGPAPSGSGTLEFVEITVADTGVGMDASTKANIFEPFFTTKEVGKGVGLGLSTVYGLVQQLGGTISVESELGSGATFRIRLPHFAKPATTPAPAPATSAPTGARILLVDDELQVRKLLEALLRRDGYEVSTAANAEEALALLEAGERFELLLTDVLMPGLSGPELSERVDARHGALPTLFISGHTDNARLRRGELPPHQRFLAKPFTPADLARTLRELLGR
ncbi:MAG: ATP-binding protein, partial [Planctomycetota bacterium]